VPEQDGIARAFSRGRTQTLEVVVPLITQHFYVEVLRGIEQALATSEYARLIRTIERRADRERVLRAQDTRGRVDGALLVSLTPTRGLVNRVTQAALPLVLVDAEHPRLPSVTVDHTAAAASAVRHLLKMGHQRIALVDRLEDPFAPIYPNARHRGYRAALAEAGLKPRPEYERVTVFAGSDSQALGMLEAVRQAGRRVPEDVAVVGYNDVEFAAYLGLTTVHVRMRDLGRTESSSCCRPSSTLAGCRSKSACPRSSWSAERPARSPTAFVHLSRLGGSHSST
jgi:LacI family transcriptional regulator